MTRHIFSFLLFRPWRYIRAISIPAAHATPTAPRADDAPSHLPSNSVLATPSPIVQPVAPAKITERPREKTELPETHNRSSDTKSMSPSEHTRIREIQKRIDRLQRENSYLRKQVAALMAEKRATPSEIADDNSRKPDTPYAILIATYNLPKKTVVSPGGWKREIPIIYQQERGTFCDCFQREYTVEEKGRFAKAIRLLAQEGEQRTRRSLKTKILRRDLPGTPCDSNYSRATHNLRFTWKQIRDEVLGDIIKVFNVYTHTSGPAHALRSIK